MDESIVVGIDIGTTKICTLVARIEGENMHPGRILGVGIEPSQGIRKGSVVDLAAASQAVTRSIDKAERTAKWLREEEEAAKNRLGKIVTDIKDSACKVS